jgi:hypothetical protein
MQASRVELRLLDTLADRAECSRSSVSAQDAHIGDAECMDLRVAPTARATDRLLLLLRFRPPLSNAS